MTVTVSMQMPDPPAGYEYTGEWRHPVKGEDYYWRMADSDHFGTVTREWSSESPAFILRRVKPATVMVELPRDVAEEMAKHQQHSITSCLPGVAECASHVAAALAKERTND